MLPAIKKAVIYCRVSTKEQVEEGNSLSTQEKNCRDYAIKNGYEIAEVFIEQGESAKTAQRTELQRLLSYCAVRKNLISAVIAYKIDRVSRNTDDYSYLRILLKGYGVEIKSTSEYFENTPAGKFMENIIANVAQFDNDVRTERSVGGMKEAVREGRYVGMAPFGYSNIRVAGKCNIIPDERAPIIKLAFEEINSGLYSIDEVRKRMIAKGLLTKSRKAIAKSHFHKLIRNELYAGWINKFGERHKGIFSPIISEALFRSVQYILKGKKRRMGSYQLENPDFPLRRFVKDNEGFLISGAWSKGRLQRYPYYRFLNTSHSIRKAQLESAFAKFINQFNIAPKHYKEFKELIAENLIRKTAEQRKDIDRIKNLVNALKEKQTLLIDKNIKGFITDQILRQQLEIIERDLLELNLQLEDHPIQNNDFENLSPLMEEFLKNPGKIWMEAPFRLKLKLQWFNFPLGVIFDGKKFRTDKISSLFKVKEGILSQKFSMVHSDELTSNNTESAKSPAPNNTTHISWNEIGNELIELHHIFDNKDEK